MMVKASSQDKAWLHLYRALLRSSAASVRFCRPAARNTRRYLRDEFAGVLVTGHSNASGPSIGRSASSYDAAGLNVTGLEDPKSSQFTVSSKAAELPSATPHHQLRNPSSMLQGLHRQTHNTLAFHLSASLLASSAAERRTSEAAEPSATFASHDSAISPRADGRHQLGFGRSSLDHLDLRPLCSNPSASKSRMAAKQDQPTKAARLAHRVVSNLASLTYHHLSPHTQMQSRAHLKHNRARKPQKLSSLARVLGKVEADPSLDPSQPFNADGGLSDVLASGSGGSSGGGNGIAAAGDTMLNALHMKLSFLMPSVKPVRGPVSARLKEWDGQNADRIASEGSLRQMEWDLNTIERLLADHELESAKRKQQPGMAKQVQQLKAEAEQLRRKIKAAARALTQAEGQNKMESIAIDHLADLVAAAQDEQGILLGKNRWTRRKKGEFLPP